MIGVPCIREGNNPQEQWLWFGWQTELGSDLSRLSELLMAWQLWHCSKEQPGIKPSLWSSTATITQWHPLLSSGCGDLASSLPGYMKMHCLHTVYRKMHCLRSAFMPCPPNTMRFHRWDSPVMHVSDIKCTSHEDCLSEIQSVPSTKHWCLACLLCCLAHSAQYWNLDMHYLHRDHMHSHYMLGLEHLCHTSEWY